MATRERPVDVGIRRAVTILSTLGNEIHEARLQCGLSQESLAKAAGMSQAKVSLIERHLRAGASIEDFARLLAVVGMELSARAFPGGPRVRDAAQRRLLDKLRVRTHANLRWTFEVPMPISGDQRAWDAVVSGPGQSRVAIEAETRLRDIQALQRRVALKRRDDPSIDSVVLLVAGTRGNRLVMHDEGAALSADYPMAGRRILELFGEGVVPDASGVVML
jgi:transcriptional regulator with XRE-family HTH domain